MLLESRPSVSRKQILICVVASLVLRTFGAITPALAGTCEGTAELHARIGAELARANNLSGAEAEFRCAAQLSPHSPLYLSALARILGAEQKTAEARDYFDRASREDPYDTTLRRELAVKQWQLDEFALAQTNLEQVLRLDPGDRIAVLLLGMVQEGRRAYREAARTLNSVPELLREHPEAVIALARSYFGIGQPEKGREALAGLVTARCDPRQVFAAALVASRANQYDIAEKLFHSIRSTYPDRETLEYNLALVAYRSERLEQSAHILRELIRAGAGNGDVYSLLGWCYQKQHRSAEAVHAFEQAIRRDPDNELTYLDLATLLEDSGRLKAGLAVVKAALDRLPRSSGLWEMRGRIEVRTEQYQEAVTSYAEAIRLAPDSPEAHLGQAIALSSAGRIPQARAAFENGIQHFPRYARFHQEYGLMLLREAESGRLEDGQRAAALLESALALDETLAESHFQLGKLALSAGNIDAALNHFLRAVALNPTGSKIHYALANLYRRLGKLEEAAAEIRTFEKLKYEETAASAIKAAETPARAKSR